MVKIILAEAEDIRVLEAVKRIEQEKICDLILIGDEERMKDVWEEKHGNRTLPLNGLCSTIVHPLDKYSDTKVYAASIVAGGGADGFVSGNLCDTRDTLRPGIKIIGTDGYASSYFIMTREDETLLFADCAFNMSPNAKELAKIAVDTATNAARHGLEPRVAFVCYSTYGSAGGAVPAKLREAVKIAQEQAPQYVFDGEIQFDAAYIPEVAATKCPESPLRGDANVFIFPDLTSGNLCYKMVQRLGGYRATGPLLQGFRHPVNDLSRGTSVDDIVDVVRLTADQARNYK